MAEVGEHTAAEQAGALLDMAGDGLVALDSSGCITYANAAAVGLLAPGRDSMDALSLASTAPPEFGQRVDRALRDRRRRSEFEARLDGRALSCLLERIDGGALLRIRDDSPLGLERERTEAILSATADGLVLFGVDGRAEYANLAACAMFGTTAGKVVGARTTVASLVGDTAATELLAGGDDPVEVRPSGGDAPVIAVARLTPVVNPSGRELGTVLSLHDVTVERQLGDLKNEFVSTVSHELRTPLTSIKGYVDLILDGDAGEINDIQREFLSIVKENSDRLVDLINDMLDISRIESGRVHLRIEPLNVAEVVQGAVNTFRAVFAQTGRSVVVRVPSNLPPVAADRDRVGQVLVNLIGNAVKYSPNGGEVEVAARKKDDSVIFSVTDHGLGISAHDRRQLFTKFFRVDSALTREIGGTGLGLSICKTIVEILGGQIGVKSKLGQGSTFWFSLPLAPEEMVRVPALESPDHNIGGTILVVDRNPEVADLIDTYLSRRGYDVVKAHTADEALAAALRYKPHVITLDVILDEGDGFDLLARLKESPDTADIPVVVLSIVCDEGKSYRMGAANYLEKPIDQSRLIGMIDGIVGSVVSPTVLVVDDDSNVVRLLSRTLRKEGFAVAAAYNGAEALAAIEQRVPDIIVTDLMMPRMDGYELIQRVKTTPAWADVPIVVMTAHRIDPKRIRILDLAAHLVTKPVSLEGIAREVETILVGLGVGADS